MEGNEQGEPVGEFRFKERRNVIDWGVLRSFNFQKVLHENNPTALSAVLETVTFGKLQDVDFEDVSCEEMIKLFRTAQLIIEYFAFTQEALVAEIAHQKEAVSRVEAECATYARENGKLFRALGALKQELDNCGRHTVSMVPQPMRGSNEDVKCEICGKVFSGRLFLQSHVQRRHGSEAGSSLNQLLDRGLRHVSLGNVIRGGNGGKGSAESKSIQREASPQLDILTVVEQKDDTSVLAEVSSDGKGKEKEIAKEHEIDRLQEAVQTLQNEQLGLKAQIDTVLNQAMVKSVAPYAPSDSQGQVSAGDGVRTPPSVPVGNRSHRTFYERDSTDVRAQRKLALQDVERELGRFGVSVDKEAAKGLSRLEYSNAKKRLQEARSTDSRERSSLRDVVRDDVDMLADTGPRRMLHHDSRTFVDGIRSRSRNQLDSAASVLHRRDAGDDDELENLDPSLYLSTNLTSMPGFSSGIIAEEPSRSTRMPSFASGLIAEEPSRSTRMPSFASGILTGDQPEPISHSYVQQEQSLSEVKTGISPSDGALSTSVGQAPMSVSAVFSSVESGVGSLQALEEVAEGAGLVANAPEPLGIAGSEMEAFKTGAMLVSELEGESSVVLLDDEDPKSEVLESGSATDQSDSGAQPASSAAAAAPVRQSKARNELVEGLRWQSARGSDRVRPEGAKLAEFPFGSPMAPGPPNFGAPGDVLDNDSHLLPRGVRPEEKESVDRLLKEIYTV